MRLTSMKGFHSPKRKVQFLRIYYFNEVFIDLNSHFLNQQASWREHSKVTSFHSSPLYLSTSLTVSDPSGLLPPAGPVSDRDWIGSNFILVAIPRTPVELHPG